MGFSNMAYPILEGKVAIVAEATMGMGEASAKLFPEEKDVKL